MGKPKGSRIAGLGLIVAALCWGRTAAADTGDVVVAIDAPADSASGLGFDAGYLWISNLQTALGGGTNRVSRHHPLTGEELEGFDMGGTDVFHGLAFAEDGTIWTDNFNKTVITDTDIVNIDRTGATLTVFPAFGTIYGVAIDTLGDRLFQVDNHSVEPGGNDATGQLYVVDPGDGSLLDGPIETGIVAARGVAWDGTHLWVASNASDFGLPPRCHHRSNDRPDRRAG